MFESAVLIALDAALIGGVLVLKNPKWLVPLVVLGLPIEYFGTQTLGSLGEGGAGGVVRALLNPGKAAMVALIIIGMVRFRHEPRRLFPDSSVLVPVVGLLAVMLLGIFWSDSLRPANSVLIMPMYVAFLFVAPAFIEDRRDVERIIGAFLLAAAALAVVAIAQRVLGVFNWREILIQSDDVSYRSNATFADPNNFARYLVISMTLATALVLATGPRRTTVYLALPALGLGLIGIVATASRSGWLMLLLCGGLMILIAPIARYTKARILGSGFISLAVFVTFTMVQGGANATRIRTLVSGGEILGIREFLIKAGWAMWKDSPLIGVGSGNFQHSLVLNYINILPEWARTSLSHTSLVSLLAEQGIVGIAMFGFVAFRIGLAVVLAFRRASNPHSKLVVGWLGVSLIGILLQSQSEGRLFDEPYLWLLLAIFIAYEVRLAKNDGALASPAPLALEDALNQPVRAATRRGARAAAIRLDSPPNAGPALDAPAPGGG